MLKKSLEKAARSNLATSLVTTLAATVAITAFPLESQAVTFSFQFDNTFNGTVTPPIVGTGTFSFDDDPGDGLFFLTFLTNYNFSFNFDTNSFTNADIATSTDSILVQISTDGSDRFVSFGSLGDGPFGGSIDFVNINGSVLSFEPNFGPLYFSDSYFGTYQGTAVTPIPEPSTILGTISVLGFCTAFKRKSKKD